MPYLQRQLHFELVSLFTHRDKNGLILAGIVGCGKTTLIQEVLKDLKKEYQIFEFTGDDTLFRNQIAHDTGFIHQIVRSQTQKKALVFVDEAQKTYEVFDALKYAFDTSSISFIVSGSNPDYLNTQAKKRLQRRAHFLMLSPFSIPEILIDSGLIKEKSSDVFLEILQSPDAHSFNKKINLDLELNVPIKKVVADYLAYGGLPLVYFSSGTQARLKEIQKIVERGFESLSENNESINDTIRIELAKLHSKEFRYQAIFNKTGIRKRDIINHTIDQLINHGYLLKKKPLLFDDTKRSYLTTYSYTDPGIVSYLNADLQATGQKIEGLVHQRLNTVIKNLIPLKALLHYYKPYTIDVNNKVKFSPGEIDFVLCLGEKIIPIEVKKSFELNTIKVPLLRQFVNEKKLPFGIVAYGGVPLWDKSSKILYWPYWLI